MSAAAPAAAAATARAAAAPARPAVAQPPRASASSSSAAGAGAAGSEAHNWQWAPERHAPAELADGDRALQVRDEVQVRDRGGAWQRGRALLDTGNAACTVLDVAFAARLGLHSGGRPGAADEQTTLRGIVPGASAQAATVSVALRLRGVEFRIRCAVSSLEGREEVLVGLDVLDELLAAGFRIEGVG